MNIGDDVTINGTIHDIFKNPFTGETEVYVETKSGDRISVRVDDINTIRPKIVIPDKDERRGN